MRNADRIRKSRGDTANPPAGALRDRKRMMRQSSVASRAEPSTSGAKQWTGGRRQKKKVR